MGFASAFLPASGDDADEEQVGRNVGALLQAIAPETPVDAALGNVRTSNLCFGVPMDWALAEGRESRQMRNTLRERLNAFEPRLSGISAIGVEEDSQQNTVTFRVEGSVQSGGEAVPVEIEKRLSRMAQNVEKAL